MADEQLAELLKTQKSLTEWLEDIKHQNVDAIRREDNTKRDRLGVLNELIGLPYDKPVPFEATELTDTNPKFQAFLREHGSELCALRLMPKRDGLPKLRMRGKTIGDAYDWFKSLEINPADYKADFVPHPPDYGWSTIFVVNPQGIQGEIIWGGHHLLTQGFHETQPILFKYDFQTWQLSDENEEALLHLRQLASYLLVENEADQARVGNALGGRFVNNYLQGYFESTDSTVGTWFIDYSPTLGDIFQSVDIPVQTSTANVDALTGRTGSRGEAEGPVRIVAAGQLDGSFQPGEVLVCTMTTPEHVPMMRKAVAIVTDQGGILCHAAIVARELGIPCVVGTSEATSRFKTGDRIKVNADKGSVTLVGVTNG